MIGRIGFSVGMLVALGIPTPAFAQDAPPLQRPLPDSRFSILDSRFNTGSKQDPQAITISGDVRMEYAFRDSAIEELRARVLGLTFAGADDTFIAADARLRFDVKLADVRFVADLAVLPYDDGENLVLGGEGETIRLWQVYADLPVSDFTFRAGAFEYAWKIRPHGEPFLLDLGRAESFFGGPADRDRRQAAGGLVKWRAHDFVEVEALWMTTIEGGEASADESPVAALVNFPLSERSALFLGALFVSGSGSQRVTTWGGGADAYVGPGRELELFGEGWIQSGRISSGVSRRAWGGQAGARVVTGPWRGEVSGSWRSGDDDPADSTDETFQSCEGEERFRIVESAEFGLDWDVNVQSLRLSLVRRLGESAEARLDAGRFRMAEAAAGLDRDLGIELDGTVTWELSSAARVWISVAALFGSDALESGTADGESDTLLATIGVKASW